MLKRVALAVIVMIICSFLRAEAYTVVMKNGKVMKGILVSETADGIVFKDDAGLQFSLKKSVLDLVKMEEANKPPGTPVPTASGPAPGQSETQPQTPVVKKPARTYTSEDIERLGGLESGGAIEPGVEGTGDMYADALHSAAAALDDLQGKCQSLAGQIVGAYAVAVSAGGDGNAAVEKFIAGQGAGVLLKAIDDDAAKLDKYRGRLAGSPDDYKGAMDTLDNAIKLIPDVRGLVASPLIGASADSFQSQVDAITSQLTNLSSVLQAVQAIAPAPGSTPEEAAPEEPPADQPPVDEQPSAEEQPPSDETPE
jgi:uncharacterized protein YukE